MNAIKVRKNFLLDKELIDSAAEVLMTRHKSFSEAINLYLKAITKEPTILDTIEKSAKKRTGSFIGMLDDQISDDSDKTLKKEYFKETERFE